MRRVSRVRSSGGRAAKRAGPASGILPLRARDCDALQTVTGAIRWLTTQLPGARGKGGASYCAPGITWKLRLSPQCISSGR